MTFENKRSKVKGEAGAGPKTCNNWNTVMVLQMGGALYYESHITASSVNDNDVDCHVVQAECFRKLKSRRLGN